MALTQISTAGVKDDAITDAKLPANSVGNSEMKDDAINTAEIADNAVTNAQMADDAVGVAELSASGTASSTTYLRGDNSWSALDFNTIPGHPGGGTGLDFNDNVKVRWGTGNDLEIYHDGTSSIIKETGIGHLCLLTDELRVINAANTETMLKATKDGAVQLYYNDDVKFITTNTGIDITGNIDLADNGKLLIGTGDDLEIYHDGTDSLVKNATGDLILQSTGDDVFIKAEDDVFIKVKGGADTAIECHNDGQVELYYDHVKKLETKSNGVELTDSNLLFSEAGTAYIDKLNNGSALVFRTSTSSSADTEVFTIHGGPGGVGALDLPDNTRLRLGASSDLQIYHSSNNIFDSKGQNTQFRNIDTDGTATDSMLSMVPNGGVYLYHDNSLKLNTESYGVVVQDDLKVIGAEGSHAQLRLCPDEADDNDDNWKLKALTDGALSIQNYKAGSWETNLYTVAEGKTALYFDDLTKLETSSSGISVTGQAVATGNSAKWETVESGGGSVHIQSGGSVGYVGTTSNHPLVVRTNNTEKARIDTSGRLLINNTASNTMWGYGQGNLQLTGDYQEASASFINDESNANSHAITLAKIRGSSVVQSGDVCGSIAWNGYDGSAYKPSARIMGVVDGTPGAGDMPGRLVFETTADGGSTPSERLRITSGGNLKLPDNAMIELGGVQTGSGDLQIYHNGSNSWIKDTGTGELYIDSNQVNIRSAAGEYMAYFNDDAEVALYYNDSKKFETTSTGVKAQEECAVYGIEGGHAQLRLCPDEADDNNDNWRLRASNNGDIYLQNYADGTNWENNFAAYGNGATELHFDNAIKLQTYAGGLTSPDTLWLTDSFTDPGNQMAMGADSSGNCYIAGYNLQVMTGNNNNRAARFAFGHTAFQPSTDDTYDLGTSGSKFDDIYATNNVIQTSDKNTKNTIVTSDLGLPFINKLKPVSYKFNGKTRTHYGLVAQDIETTLSDINKPTSDFAGFIKEDTDDGTKYGLRYTEFISPLIKAIQELSTEVETLKTKVAALKAN